MRVRNLREARGLSQDQLARRVRSYGLNWTTSRVSELENGRLEPTLQTLLVVVAALTTGGRNLVVTSLRDIVPSDAVAITASWSANLSDLCLLFDSDRAGDAEMDSVLPDAEKLNLDVEKVVATVKSMPPGMSFRRAAELELEPTSLAENRAARRLGISANAVKMWANSLWAQSLDEKAASDAGDMSAQRRGHATRRLVKEIEEAIHAAAADSAQ
ncbi:helix-turn-helix domain-containing protein [Microbacterium sp.]|uniref:helix-turn-helix domain-containing protein n=1 Tax=Microbacterium sp. TaxID=51671 RepID=UPI0039E43BA5